MTLDHPWPGPDLYTLRGMIELDLALDTDVTVDAAHAVLSDGAVRAFGPRWFESVTEALAAEGRDPEDLAGGRRSFGRAVRRRRQKARLALLLPSRPRVAGPRATGGRS